MRNKKVLAPLTLDVRPIVAQGGSPCGAIDHALASLQPGQALMLLVPFEPVPLYDKIGNRGYGHQSEEQPDGSWRVQFSQDLPIEPMPATSGRSCTCS